MREHADCFVYSERACARAYICQVAKFNKPASTMETKTTKVTALQDSTQQRVARPRKEARFCGIAPQGTATIWLQHDRSARKPVACALARLFHCATTSTRSMQTVQYMLLGDLYQPNAMVRFAIRLVCLPFLST
jgi:hypothetical protein